MAADLVRDDLAAEYADLDAVLAGLADAEWDAPTPAAGWAVRDQVAHLAFGEQLAGLALHDADAFGARLAELLDRLDDLDADNAALARSRSGPALLDEWRGARERTLEGLAASPSDARVDWISGPMGVRSFTTARLMETWAHGQDVVDALGRTRPPTARLRHVADLGVRTRPFAYRNRGLEPPAAEVRVELVAPDGSTWTWGDAGAADRVSGPAEDFCLVVTQRRPVEATALVAIGARASHWLAIAQCFAGPPTAARQR